jgi:hypothetical protein
VLTRDALLERSGASGWVEPSFAAALRRGVDNGAIKSLGEDFYELGDHPPDLGEWKYAPP